MLEGGAMMAAKNEAETGTELQMQVTPFPPFDSSFASGMTLSPRTSHHLASSLTSGHALEPKQLQST
jgi:hypothetical protein